MLLLHGSPLRCEIVVRPERACCVPAAVDRNSGPETAEPTLGVRSVQDVAGSPRSGEAVLAELVPEAPLAHAEEAGGSGLHLLGFLERAEDHLSLEPVERLVES